MIVGFSHEEYGFFHGFLNRLKFTIKKISFVVSRISPWYEYCSSGCCHQLGLRETRCGIQEQDLLQKAEWPWPFIGCI